MKLVAVLPQAVDESRKYLEGQGVQVDDVKQAQRGRVTEHHRWRLNRWWEELAAWDELMAKREKKIAEVTQPYASPIEQRDPVPGVDRRGAEVGLAEGGPDMKPFPTEAHVSAWSGMAPGSDESAR